MTIQIIQALLEGITGTREESYHSISKKILVNLKKYPQPIPLFFFLILYGIYFFPIFTSLKTFNQLSLSKREGFFKKLQHHRFLPFRALFLFLKTTLLNNLFLNHDLLKQMGYLPAVQKRLNNVVNRPALRLENIEKFSHTHFDAIVIGSGAGGAVVAKELSEGGMKIAVIEEGGYYRKFYRSAHSTVQNIYHQNGFNCVIGKNLYPIPTGKCLGGTTVINSGTCFRTPPEIMETWRTQLNLHQIDPEKMNQMMSRIEKEIHVQETTFSSMGKSNLILDQLLKTNHIEGKPLQRNVINCQGSGMCCFGCTIAAKQSMEMNYIPKAIQAGAKIFIHCRMQKIEKFLLNGIEKYKIKIQSLEAENKYETILTCDRLILAAGTMKTPVLLDKSGLIKGNKNLGNHLTIHPANKVFAEFDETVLGWDGIPQAYYFDYLKEEGIFFEGVFTPPDLAPVSIPFIGKKFLDFMASYSSMASFGFMLKDSTTGRMEWNPFLGYYFTYHCTPYDSERFKKAISFLAKIFIQGGAKRVIPTLSGYEFHSLKEVEAFENRTLTESEISFMGFHPLGTCRMANNAETGVCDQNQRVYGTQELYICDGSVIPTALGVNPQITIMTFATRLASYLLKKDLVNE